MLDADLEKFINAGHGNPQGCLHEISHRVFQPETWLSTYTALSDPNPVWEGPWSMNSPDLNMKSEQVNVTDFIFPIADPPSVLSCPESVMSNQTVSSTSSWFSNFVPVTSKSLQAPGSILSCHVLLPHKQINNIASTGSQFLEMTLVSCKELQCISQWDSASGDDLDSLIEVIHAWREDTTPMATPKSQHCNEKAWEAFDTLPIPQLNPSIAAPAMNPLPETVTDGQRTSLLLPQHKFQIHLLWFPN
ncbi:hypothetical protein BT96DRAFT_998701 [Gymnopus androsaceus JB14]|uniref:Uncharacterized protein n=1 Tax=Gymnopus androsaceus JB14 TaxID=1447944 RepID=A0A6A4H832_9AGAR|nr:hypothetical protein BT96DRAFT_998701 [Gymnopus androsaceus JB14]